MEFCAKGLKKEFVTAGVNEPSVFEPLKFYCSSAYLAMALQTSYYGDMALRIGKKLLRNFFTI